MASIVAVADVPTASVQITANNEVVNDTFTRVTVNGWGVADTGQAWTTANGLAADFSTDGAVGLIAFTATASDRFVTLDTGTVDQDITVVLDTNTLPTGAGTQYGLTGRFTDVNSLYLGYAAVAVTTGDITAVLSRRVAGTLTQLGSVATGLTIATNTTVRLRLCGDRVQLKIWTTSTAEPSAWNIDIIDPTPTLTSTRAGVFGRRDTGNLTPTTFAWDEFMVDAPYDSVWRVYQDGTSALLRGSPFLFSANNAVLYDTEAPLNTAVSYQLRACSASAFLTSNTVIIESGDDGWLKDPLRPYRDIKLDNCTVHSPQCISTDANIFFQRLGTETYASASGVFGIVGAARPNVIAQTRKDQESVLGIVSRKLSDITRVRDLLSPGSQNLLQLPTRYGWGIETWGTDYIQVYDDTAQRLGEDMGKPYRVWSLPFTAEGPPVDVNSGGTGGGTIGVPGMLYRDSTATGRTYAQSTALGRTYLVRTQHPTF
jgi:hypothetical protein